MLPQWGQAQTIRLDVEAVPLLDALTQLRRQAEVDLVYADALLAPHRVSCRYEGEEVAEALACLLRETPLVARQVQPRQYVIAPQAGPTPIEAAPPPERRRRGTLAGFVVDGVTGETLPGAHIYLSRHRRGGTTNEAGYFALPNLPVDAYDVYVTYLGYAVLDTTLAVQARAVTLRLDPITLGAGGVVVEEAHRRRADQSMLPGVVALPIQQLEQLPAALGGQDLFQALTWQPGILRSGEARGGLIVRGSGPDQNLYLIDGAPIYHPWHAFSLISTFQTQTLKDIQLFRGTFPAEHGGRLSSVLEAELRDGSQSGPRAHAALNLFNARFLIESPITSQSSFMLSGRRSYVDKLIGSTHPVEDDFGRRDTLRTGYFFYDLSAKLTYRYATRSRFALSYYAGQDVLDLRLPFVLSRDFSDWLRPADLIFEVDQHWGNRLLSFRYQYLRSRRLFMTLTAYDSRYDAAEETLIVPTSTTSVTSDYRVRLRDLGVKLDVDYYPALAHQVRAGVQVVRRDFESTLDALLGYTAGIEEPQQEASRVSAVELVAYVQDVWQPGPRWQIQPGLRASYFAAGRYTRLSPRLSLQYAVHPERLVVRAGATTQVQYIHRLRDRFSFLYDLVSSRWIPAGDGVRPSRGGQLTVGIQSRLRPWLQLTADAYVRGARQVLLPSDVFQTKDGLEGPGIEVGTLLGQYTPGRARTYGLELGAHAQRGPWQAWLSYAGGRSQARAPALGETRYRPSRYDVPRAFEAVVRRGQGHWDAMLAMVLRSGYPLTVPVARYAVGSPLGEAPQRYLHRPDLNNGRLPPYFRLDASVGYRFRWLDAKWYAQLQAYNLTFRHNVIGRTYDPAERIVMGQDRNGLPLLPLFELEVTL